MSFLDKFSMKKRIEATLDQGLARTEEIMNVAPSNLEAARSQVQKSNAEIDAKMPGWI